MLARRKLLHVTYLAPSQTRRTASSSPSALYYTRYFIRIQVMSCAGMHRHILDLSKCCHLGKVVRWPRLPADKYSCPAHVHLFSHNKNFYNYHQLAWLYRNRASFSPFFCTWRGNRVGCNHFLRS